MRRLMVLAVFACLALFLSMTVSAVQFNAGFGSGGMSIFQVTGSQASSLRIARQSTGKLIVSYAYTHSDGNRHGQVMRLNTDGTLDTGFGTSGITDVTLPNQSLIINDLAVDTSDRILLGGYSIHQNTSDFAALVVRLTAAGSPDAAFDTDGYVLADSSATFKSISTLFVDGDAPYLAGQRNFVGIVYKLTNTGALDSGFDTDGVLDFVGLESVSGLTKTGSNIVAAAYDFETEHAQLWRFSTAGVLDNTFDGDGKVDFSYNDFNSSFGRLSIMADTSGNLIVSGEAAPDVLVAKVTSGGALDGTFGIGGLASADVLSGNDFTKDLVVDVTGKPLVLATASSGGSGEREIALLRFTTAGVLDSSFGVGGKFAVDVFGFDEDGQDMLLASSDLFVAGFVASSNFESVGSEELLAVIKLDTSTGSTGGKDFTVLTQNTGFESSASNASKTFLWAGTNLTSDVRKCDKPAKNKFYAYTRNCAFTFKGGAGENSSIKQTISNFGATIVSGGEVLDYDLMIQAPSQLKLKLKVKLVFTAGGSAVLIDQLFTSPNAAYTRYVGGGFVVPQDVKKITVTLNNKATGGKTYVDNVNLAIVDFFFPGPRGASALPLPPAPAGFRTAGG